MNRAAASAPPAGVSGLEQNRMGPMRRLLRTLVPAIISVLWVFGFLWLVTTGKAQTAPATAQTSAGRAGDSDKSQAYTLPPGTLLYLRLETPVSTTQSHLYGPVRTEVIRDVTGPDGVEIPVGAIAEGRIEKLIPSSNPTDRAKVLLRFDRFVLPGRPPMPVVGHVKEVENARETVLPNGTIVGVLASELPLSMLESAVGKIGKSNPHAERDVQKAREKWFGQSDTSIDYPAGTDVDFVLDKPLTLEGRFAPAFAPELPAGMEGAVRALLAHAPKRVSGKDGAPGDPLNLVFIGSEEQIQTAFHEAGWIPAAKMSQQSLWDAVRAMIADQGYDAAPLSDLYLLGRRQDLAFEKMLNTMAKRHHLRLWRTGGKTPAGRDIWLAAATHDDGVDIHPGVVSHAIDPDLDSERAKVGADLGATGAVAAEQLVMPSEPLHQGLTATGGTWKTDGNLLVIDLEGQRRVSQAP